MSGGERVKENLWLEEEKKGLYPGNVSDKGGDSCEGEERRNDHGCGNINGLSKKNGRCVSFG